MGDIALGISLLVFSEVREVLPLYKYCTHSWCRPGLTLGRVCLMWLNKIVGERRIIFFYAVIAIGFVHFPGLCSQQTS